MKILILGGTGAMGQPVTKLLADKGADVYVTTRSERKSTCANVYYIKGNAHEMKFIDELLMEKWDAIIDFMVYSTIEFENRYKNFLASTQQYVFLSSSRVYAESETPITEESPRLLNVISDEVYLQQKEYALEKARQEDLLIQSKQKNWTIIRPYITYNDERLQLGVLEKEAWLYRALQGKSIVFSRDIAEKYTTMTHGNDVAKRIVKLVGQEKAFGQVFHITDSYFLKWKDVLEIYLDAIKFVTGYRPKVCWVDNATYMQYVRGNVYQIKYDRLYNRKFDNSKIAKILSLEYEEMDDIQVYYIIPQDGLAQCIIEFIKNEHSFKNISWEIEGYHDRLAREKTSFSVIPNKKAKLQYSLYRYAPIWILKILKRARVGK